MRSRSFAFHSVVGDDGRKAASDEASRTVLTSLNTGGPMPQEKHFLVIILGGCFPDARPRIFSPLGYSTE